MSSSRHRGAHIAVLVAVLGTASAASAFEPLFRVLPASGERSALFGDRVVRAYVKDGHLIGRGVETSRLLTDGRLELVRTRTYHSARHPETGKVVKLPDPWHVRSKLTLSPELRLIESDTRLQFHRSIDRAMGYPFTEEMDELFEWDRAHTRANARGDRLTRTLTLRGRTVERDTYDYPADAIPLEIVGTVLAHAVKSRVPAFDFELLLPGGSTHGIHSKVHRTRQLKRFARGYAVPLSRIAASGELAVIEMWLASPVKRVFFPHRFYMVFASDDPRDLIALWGGDPDQGLLAVRE